VTIQIQSFKLSFFYLSSVISFFSLFFVSISVCLCPLCFDLFPSYSLFLFPISFYLTLSFLFFFLSLSFFLSLVNICSPHLQDGYNTSSLLNNFEGLRGKDFMINHGVADDNVHYQNSMMLIRFIFDNLT
jgi:hypothetical protein